jgi:CTP:molybdopterin cytidylyltransferase MocA
MNFLLLAAGRGQRMGSNKALMIFHGEPWVQFQVRQIAEAGFENILIVTNPESAAAVEEFTAKFRNVQIFVNEDPDKGQFSSLQIAIQESNESSAFVSPMDSPLKASTLKVLKEAWQKSENIDALIPSYHDQGGQPIALSAELQEKILSLDIEDPNSRLEVVLKKLTADKKRVFDVEDPFITLNLDTPEDLEALNQIT